MTSVFTLNRHRLYDIWSGSLTDIQNPTQSSHLGLRIIANSILNTTAQSLTAHTIVVLTGIVAGVFICTFEENSFLAACNTVTAFMLWAVVRTWALIIDTFFPDQSALDTLDKVTLFMTADGLEMGERIAFLNLQTRATIAEYLAEGNPPERMQELLRYYQNGERELPERVEDAIYIAGAKIRKLQLDHGQAPSRMLQDIARKFPHLEELSINDNLLNYSAFQHIATLTALRSLKISKLTIAQTPQDAFIDCLVKLPNLESLELPGGDLSAIQLRRIVDAAPKLHTFVCTHLCTSTVTIEHMHALKTLKDLAHLSLVGPFGWSAGALQAIGELEKLTHLTLKPAAASPNVGIDDARCFGNLLQLAELSLARMPINDRTLSQFAEKETPLHTLSLTECNDFTHEGIQALGRLLCLKDLTLIQCSGVQDTCIPHIGNCTSLQKLHLEPVRAVIGGAAGITISDNALQSLKNLVELESCSLIGTGIATNALQELCQNCSKLQTLVLDKSAQLIGRDLKSLQLLPNLQYLSLNNVLLISDSVAEIAKIEHLTHFSYKGTHINADSWKYWTTHASIRSLNPREAYRPYTAEEVALLPPTLRELHIMHFDRPDLLALHAQCPNLTTLTIRNLDDVGNNATMEVFENLRRFQFLETLDLRHDNYFFTTCATKVAGYRLLSQNPRLKRIIVAEDHYRSLRNAVSRDRIPVLPACVTTA